MTEIQAMAESLEVKTSNLTVSKSGVKGAVVPLPRRLSLEWVLAPIGNSGFLVGGC